MDFGVCFYTLKEGKEMRSQYMEVFKKIVSQNANCGVKVRNRNESIQVMKERISQLSIDGKRDTNEYKFLVSILKASLE